MNVKVEWTFWKALAAGVLAWAAIAAGVRFSAGLGAATNLSDQVPWGLWVGFDVIVGVGLAAGGFMVAAIVHIFQLERWKAVSRPAVLTAFLGYLLVCGGLMFDLGQPWRIWHPLILWNERSVMFEVSWCVTLYTTVLFLEFLPLVLERFGWRAPLRAIRAVYLPIVLAGVLLSILHQSSLGSMYLILAGKLDALWYTPLLPMFFLLSAIGAGLSMVIVEGHLSHRAFRTPADPDLEVKIGRAAAIPLLIFATWKISDLVHRDALVELFRFRTESLLFAGEMLLGVLLPAALFLSPLVERSGRARFAAACLAVVGFVLGRLNVAITGVGGFANYRPSFLELGITAGLVTAGFIAFALAAKYLNVFGTPKTGPMLPAREPLISGGWLVAMWMLLLTGAVLVTAADRVEARTATRTPAVVLAPAVALALPGERVFPQSGDSPGVVTFRHESHVDAAAPNCLTCHAGEYPILGLASPRAETPLTHERFDRGEACGRCHDGETAFDRQDDCTLCHQ